ncbi:MAG TPA: DM9 repeat-containing protein [Candidatus Angelobacter sp.]|nr:DM9 repeat-containing protein [Candidatus Angelobacter sp.]
MTKFILRRLAWPTRACLFFAVGGLFCGLFAPTPLNGQGDVLVWKLQQAPAVPGAGSQMNGGSTAPAFLCRAKDGAGLYPGQWVNGVCAIARHGSAALKSDFEVAYGKFVWGDYQTGAPVPLSTGHQEDGSPLYSCRVQYRGYQVGVIADNKCAFALDGRYIAQRPPFEALYSPDNAPASSPAGGVTNSAPPSAASPSGKTRRNQDDLGSLAPGANGSNPGSPANSCRQEVGKAQANLMVKQCLQVSTATHPPCNADNSCALIQSEIKRGCIGLGNRAPDFCEDYR